MSDNFPDRSRRDLLALAPAASLMLTPASSARQLEGGGMTSPGWQMRGEVSVSQFGARGNGVDDDQPAIAAAVDDAVKNGCDLVLPSGVYRLGRSLDLGFAGLRVRGRGKVILRYGGKGPAVTVDAGEDRILYDHHLENLLIVGDGSPQQDGLFMRNMVHSTRRDLRVTNVSGTAFRISGDVLSTYDRCRVADNETSRGDTVPAIDFHVHGSRLNKATTACLFINCMAERASRAGWEIEQCDDSRWIGGTAEGTGGVGLRLGKEANGNSFESFFLEYNAQGDIVCAGRGNVFHLCNATSAAPDSPYERIPSIRIAAAARDTRLEGGRAFAILIEPGASNTRVAHADIAFRIDDRGQGTAVADCRQGYQSEVRYPGHTLGNIDNPDPLALDWYREAPFTPVLVGSAGRDDLNEDVVSGMSTRIGNVVFVTLTVRVRELRMPADGAAIIRGLPYASSKGATFVLAVMVSGTAGGASWLAQTEEGTDRLRLFGNAAGRSGAVNARDIPVGTTLTISGHYMV